MNIINTEFCKLLPKLEFHAHLNGSLSINTLRKLETSDESIKEITSLHLSKKYDPARTLSECFQLFAIAHKATNNPEGVYTATCDIIEEFADDGVIYLELRTTPRAEPGMTKSDYIDAVIKGIESNNKIIVKLLLSMDRKKSFAEAAENMELAMKYRKSHPQIVVGVDVSGDPSHPEWFKELVMKVKRESDLKVTIHCGETAGCVEVNDILDVAPDRIGHGTCISPKNKGSKEVWDKFIESQIPVELCLTSNILCQTTLNYDSHHIKEIYKAKHPFVICTDDKGVFNTTLSNEYDIATMILRLADEDIYDISYRSVEYAFCSDAEKAILRKRLEDFSALHLIN